MKKRVCVFASSSNDLNEIFYKDAAEVGKLLGQNGYDVVYGGSRLGAMYACVSEANKHGSNIIGVMPQKIIDLGVGNPYDCSEFYVTSGMRERKAKMDEVSDAVIAIAGGFGTLEEISEMIVQKQLGYNKKPIIILNTNGFYNNLIRFFDDIIKNNFARINAKMLYYVANTPLEALNYLLNYNESDSVIGTKWGQ